MRKLDEIKRGLGGKSKLSRLQASRLKGGADVAPPPVGNTSGYGRAVPPPPPPIDG